jgi:hypothetical protein
LVIDEQKIPATLKAVGSYWAWTIGKVDKRLINDCSASIPSLLLLRTNKNAPPAEGREAGRSDGLFLVKHHRATYAGVKLENTLSFSEQQARRR